MNIIEISSTQNDLVKYCVKLQTPKTRKNEKLIFVDGEQTILGLIEDNIQFEYFFCLKNSEVSKKVKTNNLVYVNNEILKKISTTKSPVDMAGIIKEPIIDINIFNSLNKIVLIDGIKDAGNLGTIIRSACAFSMDGIILINDCVDIYNSKTIRAAAQNMFKLPIIHIGEIELIKKLSKTHQIISTVVNSDTEFKDLKIPEKFILAFGSEADGLSDEIINISDKTVTFKMANNVESLNLGVCASISFALIDYLK